MFCTYFIYHLLPYQKGFVWKSETLFSSIFQIFLIPYLSALAPWVYDKKSEIVDGAGIRWMRKYGEFCYNLLHLPSSLAYIWPPFSVFGSRESCVTSRNGSETWFESEASVNGFPRSWRNFNFFVYYDRNCIIFGNLSVGTSILNMLFCVLHCDKLVQIPPNQSRKHQNKRESRWVIVQ